ncbi:hypothetical protein SAMN05216489_05025 [Streptomyces sp. 3213]|nr:hypothetical protein SAMN05216489_05025 [Streptomyces sp. 3213] [Streptomyces sp. 3213.3]
MRSVWHACDRWERGYGVVVYAGSEPRLPGTIDAGGATLVADASGIHCTGQFWWTELWPGPPDRTSVPVPPHRVSLPELP